MRSGRPAASPGDRVRGALRHGSDRAGHGPQYGCRAKPVREARLRPHVRRHRVPAVRRVHGDDPPQAALTMLPTPWFERKFNFSYAENIFPCLMERLAGTPLRLRAKLTARSGPVLTAKPGGKWSVLEQI